MAECTAAAGSLTIAMIMLPDRSDGGVSIDCSAVVVVSWRFVTVMMVTNVGVSGMLGASRNSVTVRPSMAVGCHHDLSGHGRNGKHERQQRCKRHPPRPPHLPPQAHDSRFSPSRLNNHSLPQQEQKNHPKVKHLVTTESKNPTAVKRGIQQLANGSRRTMPVRYGYPAARAATTVAHHLRTFRHAY